MLRESWLPFLEGIWDSIGLIQIPQLLSQASCALQKPGAKLNDQMPFMEVRCVISKMQFYLYIFCLLNLHLHLFGSL